MGNLNDFEYYKAPKNSSGPKKKRFALRLLAQSIAAVVFFLVIFNFVAADGLIGNFSRYVSGDALQMESSWLSADIIASVSSDKDEVIPHFTIPVSGTVVKQFALKGETDGASGIIIKCNNGSAIKTVAEGTVIATGQEADSLWIKVTHSGGFTSIYQGLVSVSVTEGQTLIAQTEIGKVGEKNLAFALLQNELPVDPLEFLLGEQKKTV
ncbi:MAG: peptidoglycan DD-metalloendopeptidase family protein [Bacillota bacterium]